MRVGRGMRRGLAYLAAFAAAACGGGGGGGGGGPGPTSTLYLSSMSGASESTVVDSDAKATAFVRVASDGNLTFSVTGESEWTGSVTALALHVGAAGTDGPVVVDLLSTGASFDPTTSTASGAVAASAGVAGAILANPAGYYVDVRTSGAPTGLARDQLHTVSSIQSHALLLGSQETTVVDANARGAAALEVHANGSLGWIVAMKSPVVTTITQAHIHQGAPGVAGPIFFDLDAAAAVKDAALGTMTGSVTPPLSVLSRVVFDPSKFYVNVHTAAAPNGVARGGLATNTVELWCALRGDLEVVVANAAARGGCALGLESFSTGRAYVAMAPAQGIATMTGAGVHAGAAGATGAQVIDLMAGGDFGRSTAANAGEGEIALDMSLYARLLGNPGAFYVEFLSSLAPGGLERGQLTSSPPKANAVLTGAEQVPPADLAGLGAIEIDFTGVHSLSFALVMTNPSATTINQLHVHEGTAGVNGPILIDLLGGSTVLAGQTITGNTLFSGTTAARVIAFPAGFYANGHTPTFPSGAVRGQLVLLSEDTPPAGLVYSTPVTYVTGTAIAPNVPHSTGGAVATYTVSPFLPTGLVLNGTTGVITGTPTVPAGAADYTVTATNASGFTQATVHVTVNVAAPSGLAYTSPVTYIVGTAISPNSPTSTGGAISTYSVSPALPAGLGIDGSTGVISGTPTVAAAGADYTVTGSNAAGSTPATVHIQVDSNLTAPSGLSYTTPVTYTTGTAITPNSPTIGGGPASSWSISPALSAGLSFDTSNGVISGTPTATAAGADHTVTASNAAGSTQATVHVQVDLGAPTNLSYDYNPGVGYVSYASFTTMTPSSQGGAVSSYSISAALPAGLNFNTTTGVISGTPTATAASTNYTVTATNAAGSTQVTVTIIVYN